ncbi:uncharacterized protein LOC143057409 [Mytilus galloprovincialis]|uniref:uncharacterized protein LOC143057409 n=1 Tax=Mytilus galloprovincialis TaxID=29158 RepID=UPI003F7CB386
MTITSGSFGEGLELKGSDIDTMFVIHYLEITEQTKLYTCPFYKAYFLLDTANVKPGFAYLRLMKGNAKIMLKCRSVDRQLFLSSVLYKKSLRSDSLPVIHGPCLSDKTGTFDFASCLHSKSWITPASKWTTRSNNCWPTSEVKKKVIDHGVLFVPIGTDASLNEDLLWRISFSVGEKFLITSFTHTQFSCYALMKILLKDVIDKSRGCNALLCSYFVKTIIFWISEEIPTSVWKPDNLIPCFMRCFKRLVYCVEYSMCPHYFIPENNLFENKIIGHGRTALLKTLYMLIDYGWRCIFFSPQISIMSLSCRATFNVDLLFSDFGKLIKSKVLINMQNAKQKDYVRHSQLLFSCRTKKLRSISLLNYTQLCYNTAQTMQIFILHSNKYKYIQYKQCLCYLLQSTHQDAVTGWLMLASLFYKKKQYNKAIYVLSYSLLKCTAEKLYHDTNVSHLHRELFRFNTFRKLKIIRILRIIFISFVVFVKKSKLIPDEIKMDAHNGSFILPTVVYLHFLTFLCHYRLHNVRNCQESLGNLRLIIEEDYLISGNMNKANAYHCLGVAFLIIGDRESAREAFVRSIDVYPDQLKNCSFQRLAMMDLV